MKFKIKFSSTYLDILLILSLNLVLSVDFSRLGNIYAVDVTYFPYFNNEVAYKYLIFSIYGYNPWIGNLQGFSIGAFLAYYLVYLFSNIPFSYTFYSFFLMSIGSILVYLTIKDIINDNSLSTRFAAILGSIFLNVNLSSGGLYILPEQQIYIYYVTLPLSIYLTRKYFLSSTIFSTLAYIFFLIISMALVYFTSIPTYVLSTAIFLSLLMIFYSIKSIINGKIMRVILLLLLIIGFILLNMNELLSLYNNFVPNKNFVAISFNYWVGNSNFSPLYISLRGINVQPYQHIPLYIFLSTLSVPILYLFILINKKTRKNGESVFFLTLVLIFVFLRSMPNVPFSSFWESLFFKFPIMTDLRTQQVLVAPFLGLAISYGIGLGTYALFQEIKGKRTYKIIAMILIVLALFVPVSNALVNGGSNIVIVPNQFKEVVNYINARSNYNSSSIVFPIFATENAEKWYSGPSLFPLFLKPYVILGGGYYSPSETVREVISNFYNFIYVGNFSEWRYISDFIYLFDIHYIIIEKSATTVGAISPCPSNFNEEQLEKNIITFEKLGLLKLVYNNSLYMILKTNISSSLAFIGDRNYSIQSLLNSTNISSLLIPGNIEYISPLEYKILLNYMYINKTIYLYLMIPYSLDWKIKGGIVYNYSNWNGYMEFKLRPINNTVILYNTLFNYTFSIQKNKIIALFFLPILIGSLILLLEKKFKISFLFNYL